MYKMLVLDLDDTLLNDQRQISDENVKALQDATKAGVEIVLASGRSDESMKQFINYLSEYMPIHYYIAYNGGMIKTSKEEILFQASLKGEVLNTLIEIGKQFNFTTQLYWNNRLISDKYTERIKSYEQLTGTKAEIVDNFLGIDETIKVLFNSTDRNGLIDLKQYIEVNIGKGINCFFSKDTYLEVLHIDADKGKAVKTLAKMLNIEKEEIIGVGDSYNDQSLLEASGLSVVPSNGKQDMKNMANYITIKSNNEHAVKEVVEKFILNKTH